MEIKNEYTCQSCKNTFISTRDFKIEQDIWPVCSKKCEFKVIYMLINKCEFSNENLEFMAKNSRFYDEKQEFDRHKALFAIYKYYSNIGLSNIKYIGTLDKDKKIGTKMCPKNRDKIRDITPLRGVCPLSLLTDSTKPSLSLTSNSGGLQKWF